MYLSKLQSRDVPVSVVKFQNLPPHSRCSGCLYVFVVDCYSGGIWKALAKVDDVIWVKVGTLRATSADLVVTR